VNLNYLVLNKYLLLGGRGLGSKDKRCADILLNILGLAVSHVPDWQGAVPSTVVQGGGVLTPAGAMLRDFSPHSPFLLFLASCKIGAVILFHGFFFIS